MSLPGRKTSLLLLAAVVEAACAAGEPRWVDQREVGPFMIQATFDLSVHESTLRELPKLEQELRRVLGLRPCKTPVSVLLLKDEAEHRTYLASRFPSAPYRRALFVRQDGRSSVFAYRHAELAIDLRHECTHALLHADLPALPLWMDEGLAEYFEMAADQRAFGSPHADQLRWNMRLGFVRGLELLEHKQQLASLSRSDYQYSWAWTHFLLHGPPEATEQFWDFLGDIRRGEQPGAMSARLERVLPGANRRLVKHHRDWSRLKTARDQRRSKTLR